MHLPTLTNLSNQQIAPANNPSLDSDCTTVRLVLIIVVMSCHVLRVYSSSGASSVSRAYSFSAQFCPSTSYIFTSLSIRSPKIKFRVLAWHNSAGRSSIRKMCPCQFHLTSLARNRTLTDGILASSAISVPVSFDIGFEHVGLSFLRTLSVSFHESQPWRSVEKRVASKSRRRRLVGSLISVSTPLMFRKLVHAFVVHRS